MTAATQSENQRKGLVIILSIVALGALLLIAAAALGYTVGVPWLDNLFGNTASGGAMAAANGGAIEARGGGSGTEPSDANCFLGLICLYTNSDIDGSGVNASVDGNGVSANSN